MLRPQPGGVKMMGFNQIGGNMSELDPLKLEAPADALGLASFLIVTGLLKRLAIDSESLRELCRDTLHEALTNAERGTEDIHAQASGLIQGFLSMDVFSDEPEG
jgi:hypothetical protein